MSYSKSLKKLTVLCLAFGIVFSSSLVHATATSATYSGYVTKLNDFKSGAVIKATSDTVAKNKVTSEDSSTYAAGLKMIREII